MFRPNIIILCNIQHALNTSKRMLSMSLKYLRECWTITYDWNSEAGGHGPITNKQRRKYHQDWMYAIKWPSPVYLLSARRLSDSPSFLLNIQNRLPDSASRGVVFRLRISPRIRSQKRNCSKGSVRDLWGPNFCKNPRKSASLPFPFNTCTVTHVWLTYCSVEELKTQFLPKTLF